jgi:hypothetical protein
MLVAQIVGDAACLGPAGQQQRASASYNAFCSRPDLTQNRPRQLAAAYHHRLALSYRSATGTFAPRKLSLRYLHHRSFHALTTR